MDATDLKILDLLQDDASLSIADVAQQVGLSPTPCWKRIQKLEASGVLARRVALLSPDKLGLDLSVFVSVVAGEHSDAWFERFASKIAEMPEVVDFYRLAGEVDYMLRVIVPNMSAFDDFYKRLIAVAPLRKVTSQFAMQRIKATTALPLPPTLEKARRADRIARAAAI